MSTRSKARIPEMAMLDLANDIDDAIERRDRVALAAFAAEAELTAGMDQQAARAREVLSLLESRAAAEGRAELTKIKAALQPPVPTRAQLIAAFDRLVMDNIGSGASEAAEHERAVNENARLRELNSRSEEERARQVGEEPEQPCWR